METTHGELQKYHNQEVTDNPDYRMEGMVDVSMERLSDYIYPREDIEQPELQPKQPSFKRQWQIVNQVRVEVKQMHKELRELQAKKKIEEGW